MSEIKFIGNVVKGAFDKEKEWKFPIEIGSSDYKKVAELSRLVQTAIDVKIKIAESTKGTPVKFTGSIRSGGFNSEGVWTVVFVVPQKYHVECLQLTTMTSIPLEIEVAIARSL